MCLAIPGKILSIGKEKRAEIDFGGVVRPVQMDLMPEAKIGEYVIVHAGFAIQKLSKKDALETLKLIQEAYGDGFDAEKK
ncbi:MAG TPA: HypC/HybG/HupF family hydrogenase formation chaperone [Elusimicrobia bacterium]|nr:MAG: hydrogenase [Elusimicrobia bacterium RIFOXYA12_FULL_49_49]OGS10199.1 MAG: hydrogenase [Elusimicrobia bacterium RIFOXYA1_FULL_47_7]OGS11821.1 MAG: hydrogenase [Elusimicrobia bacterium RIFOXYB1_FULL_48_9]OGS16127.1 MAG: hydrogenase [Elusimicrobia bacterium RIFOXYA2_FULL_47_53]OGS26428.1 MAG: hydrogenase [Elusimicrobia bacterium RIFOXYB12_FULL_50_12]OGS29194.1 MAG: hydrogenase [Elusimicrobia bacterium RIFOXYB2_FULL_46_23]HBU69353.1 HypC/HybG/HupF family hydrogenase formation chaperone [E